MLSCCYDSWILSNKLSGVVHCSLACVLVYISTFDSAPMRENIVTPGSITMRQCHHETLSPWDSVTKKQCPHETVSP